MIKETRSKLALLAGAMCCVVSGCEAPLQLEGVRQSEAATVHRTDSFQDVSYTDTHAVFVGGNGVIVELPIDEGEALRTVVGDASIGPDLIDIEKCSDGRIYALDLEKNVWERESAGNWTQYPIDTIEDVQSLACAPNGDLWVSAGFATLISSSDGGASWDEQSFDDDLLFTSIQFTSGQTGYAIGEFNGLAKTIDGGDTWENLSTAPDVYPLATYFRDELNGWIAGLGGEIHATNDGGLTWQQEDTSTTAPLYRITEIDGQLYAVGNFGVSLMRRNNDWVEADLGVDSFGYLRAFAGRDGKAFLGGQSMAQRTALPSKSQF